VVMRVDARTESSRPTFEAEKSIQRQQYLQSARQQKVDEFLTSLRESVKVEDRRSEVLSALRRQSDS
jgi:peptidyl-prolyl cis-trans isomerase D